jgi:hypothetical protein
MGLVVVVVVVVGPPALDSPTNVSRFGTDMTLVER